MPKLSIDRPNHRGTSRDPLSPEEAAQNALYYDESNGFRTSKQYLDRFKTSRPYELVKDFHQAFDHPVAATPTEMDKERRGKRFVWILEELDEFQHADHLVDQVDALIDILYLTYGTFVELGVDPTVHFQHVHDANMRKLGMEGKPLYKEDGKVAKPEGWRGPELDITRSLVLSSIEQFRQNPMFSNLDMQGIKDLRRKYDRLQTAYGDQLEKEYAAEQKAASARRFAEEMEARNNPLINASKQLQFEASRTVSSSDSNEPRLT